MSESNTNGRTLGPWELGGDAFRARLERLYDLTAHGPLDASRVGAFAHAQEEVLSGLLEVEARRLALRRDRAAHTRADYERTGRALDRAEAAIRRGADAIAWHMVAGQLWILRRLHTGEPRPPLGTSGWEAVAAAAREYNERHPGEFALMSDLTSFIDVGDLLARGRDSLTVIEVKTGKVNDKILTALRLAREGCDFPLGEVFAAHGDKAVRQTERIMKQAKRIVNATNVLNTGRGTEYGMPLRVFGDEVLPEEDYTDRLGSIMAGTAARDWSIGEVDNCLMIGAYKGAPAFKSGAVFSAWVDSDPSLEGPTFDLGDALFAPLACPLHVHPTLRPYAIPVVFGELRVLLRLGLPSFARLANEHGLRFEPMSRADTEKHSRTAPSRRDIFRWNGRACGITYREATVAVGTGLLGRVFHNQSTPRFVLDLTRRMMALLHV